MNSKVMKSRRNILILGARGMLGSALSFHFNKAGDRVVPSDRTHFDILKQSVEELDLDGFDFVVNAIGLTNLVVVS